MDIDVNIVNIVFLKSHSIIEIPSGSTAEILNYQIMYLVIFQEEIKLSEEMGKIGYSHFRCKDPNFST